MIEYDMEIKKLNQKFYNDYPENQLYLKKIASIL